MRTPQASYRIHAVTPEAVFIVDNDTGRSITNDAEAVTWDVWNRYGNRRIIYRDTDGRWDELLHADGGKFVDFMPYKGMVPINVQKPCNSSNNP